MLATWLSYDDLERLVVASLTAPVVGHSVDLRRLRQHDDAGGTTPRAAHIGYRPQDSSEPFRAAVEARQPVLDLERSGRRSTRAAASSPRTVRVSRAAPGAETRSTRSTPSMNT